MRPLMFVQALHKEWDCHSELLGQIGVPHSEPASLGDYPIHVKDTMSAWAVFGWSRKAILRRFCRYA